jgi:hypothetical protein
MPDTLCHEDTRGGRHGKIQFNTDAHERVAQIEAEEEDATLYHTLIVSLRYLVHARSDLSFTVGYLNRSMQWPTTKHMVTLKRVLHYITGKIDYNCFYRRGSGGVKLVDYSDNDYSDNDYADDIDNSL